MGLLTAEILFINGKQISRRTRKPVVFSKTGPYKLDLICGPFNRFKNYTDEFVTLFWKYQKNTYIKNEQKLKTVVVRMKPLKSLPC